MHQPGYVAVDATPHLDRGENLTCAASVERDEDMVHQQPGTRLVRRAVVAALLASLLAAMLIATISLKATLLAIRPRLRGQVGGATVLEERIDCGLIEDEVDYWTEGSNYEDVYLTVATSSADLCRTECEVDPGCGMWTWGKQRDVEDFSDVCFLKELKPGMRPKRHRKAGVQAGLICRAGAVAAAGSSTSRTAPAAQEGAVHAAVRTECGFVANDTEYWTKTPLYQLNEVMSAEACRKFCREDARCGAWSWGEARGMPGSSDVCFLKEVEKPHVPQRFRKLGTVSGFDCHILWADSPVLLPYETPRVPEDKLLGKPKAVPRSIKMGPDSNCSQVQDGVEIWSDMPIRNVANVTSMSACYQQCEDEPECGAWSWGELRNVPGLSDVCFLDKLEQGQQPKWYGRRGVVSGRVCRRPWHTGPLAVPTKLAGGLAAARDVGKGQLRDCSRVAPGVNYETRRQLRQLDDFESADMCSMQCSTFPNCQVWTWHDELGISGLSNVCLLKALEPGEEPVRLQLDGAVSGFSCKHPEGGLSSSASQPTDGWPTSWPTTTTAEGWPTAWPVLKTF